MIRTEQRLRLCTVLLVLNLAFIWGNSMLPGEISGAFSDWVKELLASLFPGGMSGTQGGGLLRKAAHFAEFALLGAALSWLFGMLRKKCFWPFICGTFAACIDETIQVFVPDRGPSLLDVGIDTCGVLMGILLLHFGYFLFRKKMNPTTLEEN